MTNDADVFDALKHRVEVDQHGTRRYFNSSNNQLHRENGPAIEYADGSVLWYLHGKQYSKTRFYQQLNFLKGVSSE